MAAQSESPQEAVIAAEKLRIAEATAESEDDWRTAWASQQEHERIAEEQARRRLDDEIASIVRRWEHGRFTGLRANIDAAGARVEEKER